MNFIRRLNQKEINLYGLKKITKYMLLFMVSSIIGYIFEEILYYVQFGKITNRGFFYGPYLTIYGVGTVLVTIFLKNYKKNPFLIFILSMILLGILEGTSGFLIHQILNERLWEYKDEVLNIGGYVCLKSVVSFGFCGVFTIYLLEPLINNFTNKISKRKDIIIDIIIPLIFIIDLLFVLMYRYPN